MKEYKKSVTVNIKESQTIIELSDLLRTYQSEIFIINETEGDVQEINPKSLLGLATLRLRNGVNVTVRAEGTDAEEAVEEVVNFLQANK
ncbi:HPr family phosphocarrier protein [Alteribacillus sp. YIM 98480]|uniref:HPr family phosphocarrier protein n=1 Tax=Alteribacillus sp. YIM 98480 TaxID=2606599 RepID=UPI00131D0DAC|nr:HPr family phosphocarrier protein [Alteribacillus sp. YIM 98480]